VFTPSLILMFFLTGMIAGPQDQKPETPQPQVRLNYLHVCTPSAEEQAVLSGALGKAAGNPAFSEDFEISRGRTTLKDAPAAKFVRLRRDFAEKSPLLTVQYSMSVDEETTIETLVLRVRDPKEFYELSMEDRVSAGAASPVAVVTTDTPAVRVRVERLGKGSVVLARCEGDQSAYEPLFKQASDIMAKYRSALGLRTAFRSDIAWLSAHKSRSGAAQPAASSRKQP